MFRISSLIAGASLLALTATSAFADKNDDTLRIGWGGDGVMINADNYLGGTRTGIWFTKMVWDTLIERDNATGEYKGSLATAWQWVDDKTLELKLREGVSFHNGAEFGADDVVFTYNTMSAENSGARFRAIVDWIDHVEKVDAMTVRIHTKEPFPQALEFLSGPMPIYPHKYYAQVGSVGMSNKPVGTGPYKVVEMKPGEQYTLVRNDDYDWGSPKSKAKITNVIIREIPDAQTQVAELMSGGIDVTADMSPDLVTRLAGVPGLEAKMSETLRIFIIGLDAAKRANNPAVNDVRVRQALNYAIDRDGIVKNLMAGAARTLSTPCHPLQFGCSEEAAVKYPYDPEKAKALLAEAGFADGLDLTMYAEAPAKEAEAIMGNLAAVGVRVSLNRVPYEAYRDAQISGKAPAFLFNWGSYSLADASASISFFFKGGEDDFAQDKDVIEWLKTGDSVTDPAKRKEVYASAIGRITKEAYWIPLFSGVRGYAWDADLDFTPYADEIPRFYEYSWK
ncbi:ABC transporter substrate-binding protein [Mesorhizobium microcysteis]|uniref:ABC transporter substrate-binding protein n=1 Tax=Neoaquamicrobium microcysteis TaxID=2682781 RepID=A0A5D4HC72_9HYPH|nr:ABC transporter substrate-binding protein [Mesorhizobium microcysteis]MCA0344885.1 ABC transporter substrate-binding protein [Pseudomonadota bacterium]TYR36410.1 ABC transporter substrate-binding protein [Mesorhizobium microcysteis]